MKMMEEMTERVFGFIWMISVPDTPIYPVHCPYPLSTLAGQKPFGTSARGQQGPGICEEYGGTFHAMGQKIVAEGVEEEEQINY